MDVVSRSLFMVYDHDDMRVRNEVDGRIADMKTKGHILKTEIREEQRCFNINCDRDKTGAPIRIVGSLGQMKEQNDKMYFKLVNVGYVYSYRI